jgi:hypothetical protein
MRNPIIIKNYAQIMADFNFNEDVNEKIRYFHPINTKNLFIYQVLKDWGPKLEKNIHQMSLKLKESD